MAINLVSGPNFGTPNFAQGFFPYYMLGIAASYHCMQLQGKLTNQTRENSKKPSLGTNFSPFGPKIFFRGFYLYYMLDIVASYHCM